MRRLWIIIVIALCTLQNSIAYSKIQIKYKIDNEIITNLDILEEKKYLIFLRPNLKNLSKVELSNIAENSLIREIIKKKELDRIFKDEENLKFVEEIKKNLFRFKNVNNEDEFKSLLVKNDVSYKTIIQKMKYEAMWNELIFQKYSSFVKVDKSKLKNELKKKLSKNRKYEYNLSEILFEIQNKEFLDKKYKEILEYAKSKGFKNAATKYSISNSSDKGGEIGWIKETMLSENLNKILGNMKKKEISKIIKYPNGYLIIKINDKKEMKQIIDTDKELNDMINFEQNRQLNQFSLLFYKKLKQNIIINEY